MKNIAGTFLKVSTFLLLFLLAAGCSAPTPAPFETNLVPPQMHLPESSTSALVEKFSIYLIAGGDRGRNGKPAGCNDSVRLNGQTVVNGLCDRLRFQAQLEETVKNSPGVRSAEILINGTPLEEAISNQ